MDLIPILAAAFAGIAIGAAAAVYLRTRKATTKAELLKALAAEFSLIQKMPGAAEAQALAEEQAQTEAAAMLALAGKITATKVGGAG